MSIDDTRAPLIFLRAEREVDSSVEAEFEALLAKEQPFVMIIHAFEHNHDGEPPEERKQKALFFKRIRDRLRKLCLAMIVIEDGQSLSAAARLAAQTASKGFGFSVQFAATKAQAVERGQELLARKPALPRSR